MPSLAHVNVKDPSVILTLSPLLYPWPGIVKERIPLEGANAALVTVADEDPTLTTWTALPCAGSFFVEIPLALALTNVCAVVLVEGTVSSTCTLNVLAVALDIVNHLPLTGSVALG